MSSCPMLRVLPASTQTRRTARHRSLLAHGAGAPIVVASLLAFATGTASAVVLDMEGLAPPGGETNELVTNPPGFGVSTQGDFTLTVEHGHYWSSSNSYLPAQSDLGGTASDWFLHDHDGP
ncbi:MAG TPA: hypothetical protein VKA74_05590 [Myxococcota bacterium]|nr:hypothetical protein [Myxococcota bacterium]